MLCTSCLRLLELYAAVLCLIQCRQVYVRHIKVQSTKHKAQNPEFSCHKPLCDVKLPLLSTDREVENAGSRVQAATYRSPTIPYVRGCHHARDLHHRGGHNPRVRRNVLRSHTFNVAPDARDLRTHRPASHLVHNSSRNRAEPDSHRLAQRACPLGFNSHRDR